MLVAKGVHFPRGTDPRLIPVLLDAMSKNKKVRLFFGDTQMGVDPLTAEFNMGQIKTVEDGGLTKIAFMVKGYRYLLKTNNIVKVTWKTNPIYRHVDYSICGASFNRLPTGEGVGVYIQRGKNHHLVGKVGSQEEGIHFLDFLEGSRDDWNKPLMESK